MIKRQTPARNAKCRACNGTIPKGTEAYFVASVGASGANVFICKDCVYDLINDVASEHDTFDELGEFLTMRKLQT